MTSTSESNRFTCPSCGAQQTFEPGARSLKCDYCGRLTQLVSDVEQIPAECEFVVPMVATLGDLELSAYEYMTQGRYTKDDIVEQARIVSVERHYAPFYRYRGQYEGHWSASFGYKREEPYTDWENDTQGNRRPVTRYRTVTDWRPASGNFSGLFTLIGYGGKSLSNSVAELIEMSPSIDAATSDPANYIAGFSAEAFNRAADDVFSGMPSARLDEIISNKVRSNAQGDASRDWHWSASRSYDWDTILMPIGHIKFEYGEERFNVWVDGADLSRVHGDALPQDQSTKHAVAVSFVPFLVGLVANILFFMTPASAAQSASTPGLYSAILSAAALVYGYLRRQSLLAYSASVRAALLSFQKASRSNAQVTGESTNFTKPARNVLSMEGAKPVWVATAMVVFANLIIYVASSQNLNATLDQVSRQQPTETWGAPAVRSAPSPNATTSPRSDVVEQQRQSTGVDPARESSESVCYRALDSQRTGWGSSLYQPSILEAQRRGLSVDDCRQALGLSRVPGSSAGRSSAAPPNQQLTGVSGLENLAASTICSQALDRTNLVWESGSSFAPWVAEAGRRGLTVQDCRSVLGLGNAVVAQSTSPASSQSDRATAARTAPSTRASITSQSGAVISFDSNLLSIDPQGSDVFNPRQRSYNISWTGPQYGTDVVVFVQVSPNVRCVDAREYFQSVLQSRRRRVQEITEVADTSRRFVGIAANGQGTRSGQDPFRNNEFTDFVFVSAGNKSTIVHVGARFPTQAAAAIRREIVQLVSSMTFPRTDLYGGC